jgi:hypothetical protein
VWPLPLCFFIFCNPQHLHHITAPSCLRIPLLMQAPSLARALLSMCTPSPFHPYPSRSIHYFSTPSHVCAFLPVSTLLIFIYMYSLLSHARLFIRKWLVFYAQSLICAHALFECAPSLSYPLHYFKAPCTYMPSACGKSITFPILMCAPCSRTPSCPYVVVTLIYATSGSSL